MPHQLPSLWAFALQLYRQAGVEAVCLTVQDQWQGNVNLLLWLRWLESQSVRVDPQRLSQVEAQIAGWHRDAVLPLRHLRIDIKTRYGLENAATERARKAIKMAELEAERVVLEQLESLAEPWLAEQERPPVAQGENLVVYTRKLGLPPGLTRELIKCLCGAL